jgi:hypothetical protein
MKQLLSRSAACVLAMGVVSTPVLADQGHEQGAHQDNDSFSIAVIGDWPYSQNLLDNAPKLIDSVNGDKGVRTLIHVGDIHSGSMACTSADILPPIAKSNPGWNQWIFSRFQQFRVPVVYTPGDNEWTDCHKSKQSSSGAPLKELGAVRRLFFSRPGKTLGLHDKRVLSQAQAFDAAHPEDAQFVENVMFEQSRVMFLTVNMPGGSNNDSEITAPWTPVKNGNGVTEIYPTDAQLNERTQRNAADLRWLEQAFATAAHNHDKAVVLSLQADMWDTEAALDQYTPFVTRLAELSIAFKRPVLVLNGDSHLFKDDRPLADPASALGVIHHTPAVPNLRRIVVQGALNMPAEWLRLSIDPNSPQVFGAIATTDHVQYCTADTPTCN